jgi:MoxR-like ATPase
MGIAAGRKLPGVLILENLQQASKDVQFLVSDVSASLRRAKAASGAESSRASLVQMLVKKQVGSHNLPRPFILVAMVPSSASYRKSLPQHLIDLFFLSNSLETVVPRTLPVPDSRTGPLVTQEELDTLVTKAEQMTFDGDLERYVWDLVTSARQHPLVFTPPTSRARTDLVMASKAVAALFGASFATTAHVQLVFDKALAHRIALTSSRNPAGGDRSAGKGAVVPSPSDVCNDCLDSVPTPL